MSPYRTEARAPEVTGLSRCTSKSTTAITSPRGPVARSTPRTRPTRTPATVTSEPAPSPPTSANSARYCWAPPPIGPRGGTRVGLGVGVGGGVEAGIGRRAGSGAGVPARSDGLQLAQRVPLAGRPDGRPRPFTVSLATAGPAPARRATGGPVQPRVPG